MSSNETPAHASTCQIASTLPLLNTAEPENSMAPALLDSNASAKKYICSAIGLAIMFFFGYLPPIAPITVAGMKLLGIFIGLVFLWSTVDLMWPMFPAMVLFGTIYKDLFPNSWQSAGIYEATQQSFGNWVVVFIMLCLVLCVALEEVGIIRRVALWFLSTKFARRGPRAFTLSFMLASLFIGLFLDGTPTQCFMLNIAHEIFDQTGYKKGEEWPKALVLGITCSTSIACSMTPICHVCPLLIMGLLSTATGMTINFVSYMAVCIPVGLTIFILLCFWICFAIKPDMTKLENYDLSEIRKIRPGKMEAREKWVAGLSIALVVLWLVPGMLSFIAPDSAICAFFNQHTSLAPLVLAIGFLGFVHIEGKPLLDLSHAFSSISWSPVVLLAGIMMVSNGLSSSGAGISDFITVNLLPLISGFSPWIIIAAIGICSCILTNILANTAVGAVFISAGVPLALNMGINPMYVGVAVCFGANMAFLLPSSSVQISVAYASPWCGGAAMRKTGAVMLIVCCIVMAVAIYPMSVLIYGG